MVRNSLALMPLPLTLTCFFYYNHNNNIVIITTQCTIIIIIIKNYYYDLFSLSLLCCATLVGEYTLACVPGCFLVYFVFLGKGWGWGWGSSSASSAFARLNLLLYEPQMGKK